MGGSTRYYGRKQPKSLIRNQFVSIFVGDVRTAITRKYSPSLELALDHENYIRSINIVCSAFGLVYAENPLNELATP